MQNLSANDCLEKMASLAFLHELISIDESDTAKLLADDGAQAALAHIESKLSEQPEDVEIRLWWVRLQLELCQVPSAVLSAPLEELFQSASTLGSFSALSSTTYLKAGSSLLSKTQIRLGLLMIERGIKLNESSNIFARQDADELDNLFLQMLESEKIQAPLRRESREYIDSLDERILETQTRLERRSSESGVSETSNIEVPASTPSLFTSKSILAAAMDETSTSNSEETNVVSSEENGNDVSKKRFAVFLGTCLFFFICLVTAGYLAFSTSKHSLLEQGISIHTTIPKIAEPNGPSLNELAVKVSAAADPKKNLDSLGRRIKDLAFGAGAKKTTTIEQVSAEIPDSRTIDDGELESLNKVPDTSPEAIPKNKLPKSNPERFAKTRVSSVGTSPRKTKAPELSGSSSSQDNRGSTVRDPYAGKSAKTVDGTPLRSYEVQHFDPPQLFKTITSTSVLATPSLLSKAMARLENGSHIHCTRKMGPWLEIVSLQGKIGYILAQDASPAKAQSAP
jgi:hypothetical protein